MNQMPDELNRLDKRPTGMRGWPQLDPGATALAIAVAVLVLLGAQVLPWAGPSNGWQVLLGAGHLGVLPRLFATTSALFGVLGSAAALTTRLWAIGWACAFGGGFSVVNGMWAVWSRQTAPGGGTGPGPGLVLALLAMVVLTVLWVRVAWSRPGGRANG
jgi:hypothetical protein